MADRINVQPQTLDLALYAGDGVSFRLTCKDKTGATVNITGAVEAQIRVERLAPDPPIVEFTSDLTNAATGIIKLSLTGVQTKILVDDASAVTGKFRGVWDLQWTPSGLEPFTICQGSVECVADVTRG